MAFAASTFVILRSRAFGLGAVIGIWACCTVSIWATLSETLKEPEYRQVIGVAAILAFAAAFLALVRRSWARIPFLAVCYIAAVLAVDALFTEVDPSDMYVVGYFIYNVAIGLLATVALFVVVLSRARGESELRSTPR